MKRSKKIAMIGAACIVLGIVIAAVGYVMGGRPGLYLDKSGIHSGVHSDDKQSAFKGSRLEKTKLSDISSVKIELSAGNIYILPADDYYLEYQIDYTEKANYEIKNGCLIMKDSAKDDQFIGFNFGVKNEAYVKLYVPSERWVQAKEVSEDPDHQKMLKEVDIELNAGNVEIETIFTNRLKVDMDAGNLSIGYCRSANAELENNAGNIDIDTLETNKGDISMDCGNLKIVRAAFEDMEVENDLGNVEMAVKGTAQDYKMDLETDMGSISVSGEHINSGVSASYRMDGKDKAKLKAECSCGDIRLDFWTD